MRIAAPLAILALLLALFAQFRVPAGCIPLQRVSGPGPHSVHIKAPGRYCLREDLFGKAQGLGHSSQGPLLLIEAGQVELDLMGHALVLTEGGTGILIERRVRGVVIRNGRLTGKGVCIHRANPAVSAQAVPVLPRQTGDALVFDDPRDQIRIEQVRFEGCARNVEVLADPRP